MFNPQSFENSRPDGIGVLEVLPPSGSESAPRRFVPLQRSDLSGAIIGPLASLRLVQTFGFSAEQSVQVLEAVYRFPLPGDAAVTGVRVTFGDVEIVAALQERTQAEAEYEQAKAEGRQAALATREAPDVFTLHVAGLHPDEPVRVETSFVQLARADGLAWTLRIPLTTAPRYVREDERGSQPAAGQPLALLRDPGHRFGLDLRIEGAGFVASPTHTLDVSADGHALRVRLGDILPDRDCVLAWQPVQSDERPLLTAYTHVEGEHLYFLAHIAPPARPAASTALPREALLLVDHSGSMSGPKWAAADWSVERFLGGLGPDDDFALSVFHNTSQWFDRKPHAADAGTVERAVTWLHRQRDSGGTNLGPALEEALGLPRAPGDRSRHLLIITDAAVTDSGRLLRLADEEFRRPQHRRISVLCIDAAPNAYLADALAETGGGISRYLTSDPSAEDVATALDRVLAAWDQPLLADLRLCVDREAVDGAGRRSLQDEERGWPALDAGDLPSGSAIWLAGRAPAGKEPALNLRLLTGDVELASLTVPGGSHPEIKALYGSRRVAALENLIAAGYGDEALAEHLARLGYDPATVLPPTLQGVYAETTRAATAKALHSLLAEEALTYGLASSATGFVAVRSERGRPVEERVLVANALPHGWSEHFLGVPGAAIASNRAMARVPASLPGRPGAGPAMLPLAAFGPPAGVGKAAAEPKPRPVTVFRGVLAAAERQQLLYDSRKGQPPLPEPCRLTALRMTFGDRALAAYIDRSPVLLIYVDDLAAPRARVALQDLVRGGERPLNLLRERGQVVRVVLALTSGLLSQPLAVEIVLVVE